MDKLFLSELAKDLAGQAVAKIAIENKDEIGELYEPLDGDGTEFLSKRFLIELDVLQGNK